MTYIKNVNNEMENITNKHIINPKIIWTFYLLYKKYIAFLLRTYQDKNHTCSKQATSTYGDCNLCFY